MEPTTPMHSTLSFPLAPTRRGATGDAAEAWAESSDPVEKVTPVMADMRRKSRRFSCMGVSRKRADEGMEECGDA
jgi:hypothetical protein